MNYQIVEGVVSGQLTLTGNDAIWIWCDPFDINYPIRYSVGAANARFWDCGIQATGSVGPFSVPPAGTCGGLTWTETPYFLQTNWLQDKVYALYPTPSIVDTNAAAVMSIGSSYMVYPLSVTLDVSVANNTSYSQTAMRARNANDVTHRFIERVEDATTGYYGLHSAFIKSNRTMSVWSGDTWGFPRVDAPQSTVDTVVSGQSPGVSEESRVYNWFSLNDMLQRQFPVVECFQSSSNGSSTSVTISIEARVKIALSPLFLAGGFGNSQITAPFGMPDWFGACKSHSFVVPVDAAVGPEKVERVTRSIAPVRAVRAVMAHPAATPTIAKLQQTASSNPGGFLKDVEDVASKVGGFVSDVAGGIGKVVNVGRQIADVVEGVLAFL